MRAFLGNKKIVFLLLLFIVAVIYANALHNEFLLDDHVFFVKNSFTHLGFWWTHFIPDEFLRANQSFLANQEPFYRPLANIFPMLCYQLFGDNVLGYHVVNLILHFLAGFFIFLFIKKISSNSTVAFFTATLYLVHPINGVVINYKTASVFSLMMICYVGVLNLFRKFRMCALALFLVALLIHEQAIIIPVVLIIFLRIYSRVPFWDGVKELWRFILVAIVYGIFRFMVSGHVLLNGQSLLEAQGMDAVVKFLDLIGWYLTKMVFPYGTVLIKSTDYLSTALDLTCLLIFIAVVFYLMDYLKDTVFNFLMAVCFLAVLLTFPAIMLQKNNIGFYIFEPHWLILGSIGFFYLLATILARLLMRSVVGVVIIGVYLCALAGNVFYQNKLWAYEVGYLTYASQENPKNLLYATALADAYRMKGKFVLAKQIYVQTMRGDFYDWKNYANLGLISFYQGDFVRAQQCFIKASQINPNADMVTYNLGVLALQQNDLIGAEQYFKRTIQINPYHIEAYFYLVDFYSRREDILQVESVLQRLIRIDRSNAKGYLLLNDLYLHWKNPAKIMPVLDLAYLYIDDVKCLTHLALTANEMKLRDLSIKLLDKAFKNNASMAYLEISDFYVNLRRYDQALESLKKGMFRSPNKAIFEDKIKKILALTEK